MTDAVQATSEVQSIRYRYERYTTPRREDVGILLEERDRLAAEVLRLREVVEELSTSIDLAEQDSARLRETLDDLERERRLGITPHRCLNPECGTIAYGSGYKACPSCGGTDGRAALASSPDSETT